MRKILSKEILVGALFTFCLALGEIPVNASNMEQTTTEVEIIESAEGETAEAAAVETIKDMSEEVTPTEFRKTMTSVADSEDRRFIDFFPDENLATAVAKIFKRTATDIVTQEELDALHDADLSYSSISDITGIDNMNNLQFLRLDHNQITEIPSSIDNLSDLQWLLLSNNRITEIPSSISNLPYLWILSLDNNQITEIPSFIGKVSNLRSLYLSSNHITEIPDSIGNLQNLQMLDLHFNQITEIPDSIGDLENLQILLLYNNQITEVHYSTMNFLLTLRSMYLHSQSATLCPVTISSGSNIEYTNLIPAFIRHLQDLNHGQLNGYWTIYRPDGTSITIKNNLKNAMNQFVFDQIGEYLVEYYLPSNLGYHINGKSIYDLKYTTRITTTAQEVEHRTVSYNLNGGELISGSHFEMVELSGYPSQIPVVGHSKMRFVGWTNENGIFVDPTTILIIKDTTFTAQYEEIKFVQVRYNVGMGMMIQGSTREVVEKGGKPTNVPIVKHPLGKFIGWKDQDGNFVDPATVIVTKNVIFTAYYEIDEN